MALGFFLKAAHAFQTCISQNDTNGSEDDRQAQLMSLYQLAISITLFNHRDQLSSDFSLEKVLPPLLRESWGRRAFPTNEILESFQPTINPLPPKPNTAHLIYEAVQNTLPIVDFVGSLIHIRHQGFIPNARLQRSAGLAALELAQHVKTMALTRQNVSDATKDQIKGLYAHSSSKRLLALNWRDAMDIIVRWRQLGEPKDQVSSVKGVTGIHEEAVLCRAKGDTNDTDQMP